MQPWEEPITLLRHEVTPHPFPHAPLQVEVLRHGSRRGSSSVPLSFPRGRAWSTVPQIKDTPSTMTEDRAALAKDTAQVLSPELTLGATVSGGAQGRPGAPHSTRAPVPPPCSSSHRAQADPMLPTAACHKHPSILTTHKGNLCHPLPPGTASLPPVPCPSAPGHPTPTHLRLPGLWASVCP